MDMLLSIENPGKLFFFSAAFTVHTSSWGGTRVTQSAEPYRDNTTMSYTSYEVWLLRPKVISSEPFIHTRVSK